MTVVFFFVVFWGFVFQKIPHFPLQIFPTPCPGLPHTFVGEGTQGRDYQAPRAMGAFPPSGHEPCRMGRGGENNTGGRRKSKMNKK